MAAWDAPGDILRWWRTEIIGWSQRQLADQLSVGTSTVSSWESNTRGITLDLVTIDQQLGAGGVLAELLRAVGTPRGLPAGRTWTKVYPGTSTPVWMWVRGSGASMRIAGEWGVVSFETTATLGANGLFVTVGGSVADSPVVVELSDPGWADFGRGTLPDGLPGARVVAAIDHVRPSSAHGPFLELFAGDLQDRLQRYDPAADLDRPLPAEDPLATFADRYTRATPHRPGGPWPPVPDGADGVNRRAFATLRKARGLSLSQTAAHLTVAGVACSKDTLRRFELDQGEPFDRSLPAALDHVLGAEGHLALTTIRSGQGAGLASLPPYWHAPIWIAADSPGGEVMVELRWARWARRLVGASPLLLVSHYADPTAPLRIECDAAVSWTIGLGRPRGATPINHGWMPISLDAAHEALATTQQAIRDAISHNEDGGDDREGRDGGA